MAIYDLFGRNPLQVMAESARQGEMARMAPLVQLTHGEIVEGLLAMKRFGLGGKVEKMAAGNTLLTVGAKMNPGVASPMGKPLNR